MAKRKKRKATKKTKSKQKTITWAVVGLVAIVLAILAVCKFGILGKQVANLIRLLVGDSYLLISLLLALFGFVMLIYNQPLRLKFKRNCGLFLALFGILLIQSSLYFESELANHAFINAFWHAMKAEFMRAAVTVPLGGGLIGASGYQLLNPLLGKIGVRVLACILIPVGLLMFCDVRFRTLIEKFQIVSQSLIRHLRSMAFVIKDKLQELRQKWQHKKAQQKAEKATFTDVTDFVKDFADSNVADDEPDEFMEDAVDDEPEEESEPQIQIAQPAEEESESEDLPKPLAFKDEDQKLQQELGQVDHGETPKSLKANPAYKKPPLSLLKTVKNSDQTDDRDSIKQNTQTLQATFKSFGVQVNIKRAILGPTITRYEVQPAVGVKVSRIVNLADDLALALAAKDIRIEAPIPGKPYVGIEVPNQTTSIVSFKDVMQHQTADAKADPMQVPLGKDVAGTTISANLAKMPHLLIAGSTGSGKSVAINTILTSILMKARPEELKLILIDPKMVELSVYNGVPHLLIPVVTDAKLAANALNKAVKEMERRYKLFAASGARNMGEYNQKVAENNQDKEKPVLQKLPCILVVVDELSDLMMVGGHDVEGAIVRLGQMARAAGIHMILATQRPSVDVITGLIKANVPSRISFAVSSGVDSRTILDQTGAEKLLGRGDMLYLPIGASKPERIQGAYVGSDEVERVITWVKEQQQPDYNEEMIPQAGTADSANNDDDVDELYEQAVDLVIRQQTASVSMLQRRFRIGYNRAARIVDQMEERGVVGPSEGSKPRQVLLKEQNNVNKT